MNYKLILLCIVHCAFCIQLSAQALDSLVEGQTLFLLSPNGRYAAGCGDGTPSYFYDLQEHEFLYQLPPDGAFYTNQINDLGEVAGAYGLQAAIWHQGGEWELLPQPEGLTDKQLAWSQANAISADGRTIVVSFGETPDMHCIYQRKEDGTYSITPLDLPTIEPVYHKAPQFVSIKGISADGRRIAARYLDDDGFRDIPMLFECDEVGKWTYRFLAIDTLVIDGCTLPHKPKRDEVDNYSLALQEYWADVMAMETGIYYKLSNMGISANGKYINLSVALSIDDDDYYTITHPAVIDIDADSLIIFSHTGSCPSVTDDGVVTIATSTPIGIRTSYVSSIANPDEAVTFGDYVMQRTNGVINLADIMVYQVSQEGATDIGYGSAVLSASGSAALTMQLNDWEWKYETYLIQFNSTTTVIEKTDIEQLIVFPNPTAGIVYFDAQLTDVAVYDVAGRQVYVQSLAEQMVDLSNLNAGTYVLTAQSNGENIITKVMITR